MPRLLSSRSHSRRPPFVQITKSSAYEMNPAIGLVALTSSSRAHILLQNVKLTVVLLRAFSCQTPTETSNCLHTLLPSESRSWVAGLVPLLTNCKAPSGARLGTRCCTAFKTERSICHPASVPSCLRLSVVSSPPESLHQPRPAP